MNFLYLSSSGDRSNETSNRKGGVGRVWWSRNTDDIAIHRKEKSYGLQVETSVCRNLLNSKFYFRTYLYTSLMQKYFERLQVDQSSSLYWNFFSFLMHHSDLNITVISFGYYLIVLLINLIIIFFKKVITFNRSVLSSEWKFLLRSLEINFYVLNRQLD